MPTIKRASKKKSSKQYASEKRKERQKIYQNPLWKKLRESKLICSPLCEDCLKEGIVTPATEIHHEVSFMSTDNELERQSLAFDYDNLVSLCQYHHKLRHGTVKRK